MRRTLCTAGLAVILFWCGAAGCKTNNTVKEKPLPDPLLTSKKPIEGRSFSPGASLASREEIPAPPAPPPLPAGAPTSAEASVVHLLGVRPAR